MNGEPGDHAWSCPPRDILVAVDFGAASAHAAAVAGLLASAFKARFRAIHAERFEPPAYFTIDQIAALNAARRQTEAAVLAHIRQFVAASSDYPVDPIVGEEPAVEAILQAAAGADLIVVGTHGRRGPSRWWMGSVAERVVRSASMPVLVARASAERPIEVFERPMLVGDNLDPGPEVRACAEALAHRFGGRVTEGGPAADCSSETLGHASLIVMATAAERPSWRVSDSVARVLGACERPVLFIPSR